MTSETVRRSNKLKQPFQPWQQSHHSMPPLWQASLALLALTGIAELSLAVHALATALTATMHVTAIPTIEAPRYMQSPVTRIMVGLLDMLLPIVPGVTMLIGAIASVGIVSIAVRTWPRRWRYIGACIALVAAFNVAIILSLLTTVSMVIGPSSLNLRPLNSAYRTFYVAAGRPGSSAPIQPVTVDRILIDGTATYVEYRIPDEPRDGQPQPVLFDDHGRRYDVNVVPIVDFTFQEFFNQLMPWHAPVQERAIFAPMPTAARLAILRFIDARLGRVVETVHIPLSPRSGAASAPVILANAHGISLRVTITRGMTQGRLVVTADVEHGLVPRGGLHHLTFSGRFIDANARQVALSQFDSTCQAATVPNRSTHCDMWLTFKPPRPGSHLKLEIHNIVLYDRYDHRYPLVWSATSWFAMP